MESERTDCIVCNEPVTNPLCQNCLCEAITQWLHESAPDRVLSLREETDAIAAPNGPACVHCKSHVGICTFCYTRHVFNWLRDGSLQLEFVDFFNFDFYQPEPYARRMQP